MPGNTINNDVTIAGGVEGTLLAGRFRVIRQLGAGGMGSVWLAEDTQLDNKPFAIKMLPSVLVSNKRAYRQLKDEALVAMKLVHPNIVQLRAFEENYGNPFLVMDYVDGKSLDECLGDWGPLDSEETAEFLKPIADALDYAHSQGVVHRDVKPGNIMVRKDGTPYILDFGIAREIQETMTRVTGKLSSGTLLYMSPEQLHGASPKKEQDIYSFAAMAYECLSGHPPFVRGKIEYQIDNDMPEPLPEDGHPICVSVMAGLAKKPEDRPATCSAVLAGNIPRAEPQRRGDCRMPEGSKYGDESASALADAPQYITGIGKFAVERERRKNWRIEGREFTISSSANSYLGMTMKWCPKGSFVMGSPVSEEGRDGNEVQHRVTLAKGFWIGETEVTQGQWKKLMNGETVLDLARKALQDDTEYNDFGDGKRRTIRDHWGKKKYSDTQDRCADLNDDAPVYYVSWNEAVEFCRRLTAKERAEGRIPDGYEYRLPTEAEWEYACRAGTETALPNGMDIRILDANNAPALDAIAWYSGNSSVGFEGTRGWDTSGWEGKQYPGGWAAPRIVKGKKPNNFGLYDMIGNVWEWCNDWDGDYPSGGVTDPRGPASGVYRISRGGSWIAAPRYCRSAMRGGGSIGFRHENVGFRVALAPSH